MAKPSVTNIRPPTTPPKTSWNLDNPADQNDPFFADASTDPTSFHNLLAKLNLAETGITQSILDTYGYVFMGVNGGMDETVIGRQGDSGIIVTGNGKDNVTGGDYDDLIFTGNGSDVSHGGNGDDIMFGENGPDQVFGDADNDQIFGGNGPDKIIGGTDRGEFNIAVGADVLTIKPHLVDGNGNDDIWLTDPNGTHTAAGTSDNTVRKEGDYIKLDANGHPIEFTSGGDPVIHAVFSFSPETSGDYTIGFYNGNSPDGTGEPDPDFIHANGLVAGQKYYYTFTNSDGGVVKINVFEGDVPLPDPSTGNPSLSTTPIASSQADPIPPLSALFDKTHTDDGFTFVAGDILTGGNPDAALLPVGLSATNVYDQSFKVGVSDGAPDIFIYNKVGGVYDGVDLITDYNKLEGDVLELHGIAESSVRYFEETVAGQNNLIIGFDDGSGLVHDAAIKLLGVQHSSDLNLLFT